MTIKIIIKVLIIIIYILFAAAISNSKTYIQVNQVGYKPDDRKQAVIISQEPLADLSFHLVKSDTEVVYSSNLSDDWGAFIGKAHHYIADFSEYNQPGTYVIRLLNTCSLPFPIDQNLYRTIPDTLLRFFQVQRCGETSPLLHKPCHLLDAQRIEGDLSIPSPLDVTGGWHDAGDYIKFLITTSYSAYMLLLAYDKHPELFPDRDGNNRSDLLDEVKIGLDWMMKMHYAPDRLLIQVHDHKDHDVGWRLPEDDPLTDCRAAYLLPSKAQCGSFSAAMALASSVFRKIGEDQYADRCLQHARQVYCLGVTAIPEVSTGPDSMYFDQTAWDNLTLAATELFLATDSSRYLDEAVQFSQEEKPVFWVSWGDLGGFAYSRMASYHPEGLEKLDLMLSWFDSLASRNPYGIPFETFTWGSASVQMGIAALALLHYEITESDRYLPLAIQQRDFVLGVNSHGVSMIGKIGWVYPKYFHHQVAYLREMSLPGGFAEGFVSNEIFQHYGIQLEKLDRFAPFQSEDAVYHDDRMDYITNEPTICGNATALFVFSWFAADEK